MRFKLLNFIALQAHYSIYLFDNGDLDLKVTSRESTTGSIFHSFRWVSFIIFEGDESSFMAFLLPLNQTILNALARDRA